MASQHQSGKEFQRAYKACIPCRRSKAKCQLDGDGQPPCAKCRREQRDCIFTEHRSGKRRKVGHEESYASPPDQSPSKTPTSQSMIGSLPRDHGFSGVRDGVSDHVMRTVVTSSNDALGLLFEAVESTSRAEEAEKDSKSRGSDIGILNHISTSQDPGNILSSPSERTLRVWNNCRFVRQGWFSAQEAITYVDLFFKNMAPLSSVLTDFYSYHSNHRSLLTEDSLLCCIILMISSRYHPLPGVGSISRSHFIHERLWEHCQAAVQRVMFGQERASKSVNRTLGTIESFLLLSEWHPRSLHFPPGLDGWDSDSIFIESKPQDDIQSSSRGGGDALKQWLEEVIEPAKRSDRMSWMLLGSALALSHELNIFEDTGVQDVSAADKAYQHRRERIKKLLYVHINQLSTRLGHTSMMPQNISISNDTATDFYLNQWVSLTRLMQTVTQMLFPSSAITRSLLFTERYVGLLEHFQPLLASWYSTFESHHEISSPLRDMLFIEYQHLRLYTNSLAIQAVVEKALSQTSSTNLPNDDLLVSATSATDLRFINEVVSGSRAILQRVTSLAQSGFIRYAPVRIFLRITSSSIFLFKAMCLGGRSREVQRSLQILDEGIGALRIAAPDDMHLASRYATLIEMHVERFRRNFISTFSASATARNSPRPGIVNRDVDNGGITPGQGSSERFGIDGLDVGVLDDWLAQPFDPSIAPFGAGENLILGPMDVGSLDFLWNIPP